MFSIHSVLNSCGKWERNKKIFTKNNKIKHFINKYKWEGINFPLEKDD